MKHVFFVFSPFHLAIASRILKVSNISDFKIFLFYEGSDKSLAYCQTLFEPKKFEAYKIEKNISGLLLLGKIYLSARKLSNEKVEVYTASPKSLWFRFFFSKLKSIKSFNVIDDGVGVLNFDGYFLKPDSSSKRMILKALSVKVDYLDLLKKIDCYYKSYDAEAVYDKFCSKVIAIDPVFLPENHDYTLPEVVSGDSVKILLTGPFSERGFLNKDKEISIYKNVTDSFDIQYLIKHPAESIGKYSGCPWSFIETKMYAEQVVEILAKTKSVEVYSFSSSVLANLNKSKNVKVYCLDSPSLPATSAYKKLKLPILRLQDGF